ncbi:hypothetical protein COT72_03580 [archaeon CG10_big_fil_rev_8_21_14_0_10_43_11]|nr:MAG: hypothetical protein COT72_03580 [archaeon CG10_big_fil_rev_8_21_14_0_10_43_11]
MSSTLKPVFVGIENPDIVSSDIETYKHLMHISEEAVEELKKLREGYDVAKVHFLDQMMDFLQEFKHFKKVIPKIKIKHPSKTHRKKELKQKVAARKQQMQSVKSETIEVKTPEKTRIEELERIKSFRRDLERINEQLSKLA